MDMRNNEAEYLNPINAPYFLSMILAIAFEFTLGYMIFSDGSDKSLPVAPLFWSIGSFFFVGIMWKEYIHKPKSITISDNGLLLKLRFGRMVHISWEEILWISASTGKGADAEGVSGKGGGIKATRSTFYSVSYEIGRDAQEKYTQVMGRRPMTRDQYIKLRKGRLDNFSPRSGT
jgi:hypothetical protein